MHAPSVRALPELPEDVWKLIFRQAAAMLIQRAARRRTLRRLHYGHVHEPAWVALRSFLEARGVLRRMYPFPLTRREWRTEMSSWWPNARPNAHLADLLVKDMEESNHWGSPSPAFRTLNT